MYFLLYYIAKYIICVFLDFIDTDIGQEAAWPI